MRRIEEAARSLSWNAERPWTQQSHTWTEQGVPFVDLHDLSIGLALEAVDIAAHMDLPCVGFITGRGRHNVDGRSRLREAVHDRLDELCAEHGWTFRGLGPGRCVLVRDASRSPTYATGALPWWIKLILALLVAAALLALARALAELMGLLPP